MNPAFMYVVWTAIAIAAVVLVVVLILLLIRLRPLVDHLDGTAQFLETNQPKIDRILDNLEAELVELRGISRKANRIVGGAESVATDLRVAVQPIITEVSDLARSVRHVRATAVAVRAGLSSWWDHRHANGQEPSPEFEHDEER